MSDKERFVFAPVSILADHRLTLMQTRILLAILSFRDSATNLVFPKRKTLAERSGYSEGVISRTTTQLVNLGWLEKIGKGGRSSPCKYRILNPIQENKTVTDPVRDKNTGTVTEQVRVTDSVTVTDSVYKTVTDPVRGKELTNELTNIKNNKKEKFYPEKYPIPNWLDFQTWCEFAEHRKDIKKPLSELASKKIINNLEKFRGKGYSPESLINESIANGWSGVFANEKQTKINSGNNRYESPADRVVRRSQEQREKLGIVNCG